MNCRTTLAVLVLAFAGICSAAEKPRIENPSFEADVFKNYAGVARANGGKISGWQFTGNVGINPFWTGAPQRTVFRTTVDDGVTVLIDQVSISTAESFAPQP